VVGLAALATLLFLARPLSALPQAVLASIVLVYSASLLSWAELRAIYAIRKTEFVWAVSAFLGVLMLGTLRGILVAIIVSFVAMAYQASRPAVYEVVRKPGTHIFRRRSSEHPEDETVPGILLLRAEGRIFFGNIERVLELGVSLIVEHNPRVIVLDCSAIFDVEYSAVKMLAAADRRIRERGAELWLAALNPEARAVVDRSPFGKALGRERMFFDLEHAVRSYLARESQRS